jgi:hypothetical protein
LTTVFLPPPTLKTDPLMVKLLWVALSKDRSATS